MGTVKKNKKDINKMGQVQPLLTGNLAAGRHKGGTASTYRAAHTDHR